MIESSFVNKYGAKITIVAETPWLPKVGEQFFAPDLLSLREPVALMVWRDSDADRRLNGLKFVYKTYNAALAEYRLLCGLSYMIAEEETA